MPSAPIRSDLIRASHLLAEIGLAGDAERIDMVLVDAVRINPT